MKCYIDYLILGIKNDFENFDKVFNWSLGFFILLQLDNRHNIYQYWKYLSDTSVDEI